MSNYPHARAVFPGAHRVSIISADTAASGTDFTQFAAQACAGLDIVNDTGTAIEYRRGGAGLAVTIPAGFSRLIVGISDTSDIGVRRVDQNTTSVTVKAEAFAH